MVAVDCEAGIGATLEALGEDASFPVKPQRVIHDIRKVMGDIVISDVGAHKMWIARMYPALEPNTCIIPNGFASLGIALPGAIGAKLIHPDRRVLAACGDGGFLMDCQEMETAVRVNTPIVCLIFHDNTYGLIKWKQEVQFAVTVHGICRLFPMHGEWSIRSFWALRGVLLMVV